MNNSHSFLRKERLYLHCSKMSFVVCQIFQKVQGLLGGRRSTFVSVARSNVD